MSGKPDLSSELLAQNGAVEAGACGPIVDRIALDERRRLRRWAIATAALWLIVVVYLLGLLGFYLVYIHPALHELLTDAQARKGALTGHAQALITELIALLIWPVLLLLAAGATIGFTLASRRATLRQIQASLAEISGQLKILGSPEA